MTELSGAAGITAGGKVRYEARTRTITGVKLAECPFCLAAVFADAIGAHCERAHGEKLAIRDETH